MKMLFFISLFFTFSTFSDVYGQLECFLPGECTESLHLDILSTNDQFECLDECKAFSGCEWFTYYPSSKACQLLSTCTNLDETFCSDCISGMVGCTPLPPECTIPGECLGTVLHIEQGIYSPRECFDECLSNADCSWYTHKSSVSTCLLMRNCETLDEDCTDCISGERTCQDPPTGLTKLLVTLGSSNTVQIIDLSSPDTTCQPLTSFPFASSQSRGFIDSNGVPTICGNRDQIPNCYNYKDGVWNETWPMVVGKTDFAVVPSPFQNDSVQLFLAGGGLATTEVLTDQGWELSSIVLPVPLATHCMVALNETILLLVSFYQGGLSFYFDSDSQLFTPGPALGYDAYHFSCGMIKSTGQGAGRSVIVAGGWNGLETERVSILDEGAAQWRVGPSLPAKICCAEMVNDPLGGVVLIGGRSPIGVHRNTLLKLSHAGEGASWELIPQQLDVVRAYHTAFLVPDEITNCTTRLTQDHK